MIYLAKVSENLSLNVCKIELLIQPRLLIFSLSLKIFFMTYITFVVARLSKQFSLLRFKEYFYFVHFLLKGI